MKFIQDVNYCHNQFHIGSLAKLKILLLVMKLIASDGEIRRVKYTFIAFSLTQSDSPCYGPTYGSNSSV